jgi:hypothetical protein
MMYEAERQRRENMMYEAERQRRENMMYEAERQRRENMMYEAERQRRENMCTKRSAKGAKYDSQGQARSASPLVTDNQRFTSPERA